MTQQTPADVQVLHALRTLGFADAERLAGRVSLSAQEVREHLLDAQATGWVRLSAFGGDEGWSLTEAGKAQGEQVLAQELARTGARPVVEQVYREFLPLNQQVTAACTEWQLAEVGAVPARPASQTVAALRGPADALGRLEERLTAHLPRFTGYHRRFTNALNAATTETAWITGIDRDSCHTVWFELHEDLIATLGISR